MGCFILRENFYKESPAVRAMTEEEVDEYRLQRQIPVEGRDVPKPIKSFYDVGFRGKLFDYVHRIGRTGRACAKGTAYAFFRATNARFAKELIAILEEAGQRVSPELAAMGRGAPPPPSGYGSFRDCGRGYGSVRAWS